MTVETVKLQMSPEEMATVIVALMAQAEQNGKCIDRALAVITALEQENRRLKETAGVNLDREPYTASYLGQS